MMSRCLRTLRVRSLFALLSLFLMGCSGQAISEAPTDPPMRNRAVGQWTNRYAGDPDLAGVRVQQFPDCWGDAAQYEGRHPAMILYVFKDGRVNQNGFKPDGMIEEDFWWKIGPTHYLWEQIDRSSAAAK